MAFDRKGRLLVIESHTHQRPKDYKGPASDRIRMLADSDGDGKLDQWSTFAEGFRHAMNLLVRDDGGVYLVTRGKRDPASRHRQRRRRRQAGGAASARNGGRLSAQRAGRHRPQPPMARSFSAWARTTGCHFDSSAPTAK